MIDVKPAVMIAVIWDADLEILEYPSYLLDCGPKVFYHPSVSDVEKLSQSTPIWM